MCGIAGVIGVQDKELVQLMLEPIQNRGELPPYCKVYEGAVLGNALLVITGDEQAPEPLIENEDKSIAITFNGEIYNYKDLRRDLVDKGYCFKTDTDTEVLLALYEEYGSDFLSQLDGMFAFVIYDSTSHRFLVARDAIGIKPLYFSVEGDKFYFASEMKSFLHLDLQEVNELVPGHYIQDGQCHKWYELPTYIDDRGVGFKHAKETVRELVTLAVQKRVRTDYPIGVFFGGGLDSAIILTLAKQFHDDVTPIIIGHDNSEDVIYAKQFCKERSYSFVHVDFSDTDLLSSLPDVVYIVESFEPNPIRGGALSVLLSKKAHELGLKIVLCGEGSDEIFGGYGDFLNIFDRDEFAQYTKLLTKDLYRTQLQRVDRTAMSVTVEMRVPFLDLALVEYALSLGRDYKVNSIDNDVMTKYLLREAFRDILSDSIYKRKKMTLMHGAGVGKVNKHTGIFYEYACDHISAEEFESMRRAFPSYKIDDREAAFYFRVFFERFKNAHFAKQRTINAQIEINGN